MHSPNLTEDNIARIRDLFPSCVTEARGEDGSVRLAVDFDQLRQELSASLVEGPQERYHLNWPGKREALLTANAPIAKTLRPVRGESVDFDTTKNLFIEGDNLDALKLLQETYLGKVKMIYIDPPYNTGKDFIYKDDFSTDVGDYLQQSNQADSEGGRLVANTEANGRFHSDWLTMIYPRLKLARNLLRDDGAMLISIDDNESDNLRKVCDEVFGEENFIGQIVWQRSKKGDSKLIAKVHEYILCYVRDKESVLAGGIWRRPKEGAEQVLSKYAELKASLGATTRPSGQRYRLGTSSFRTTILARHTSTTTGRMIAGCTSRLTLQDRMTVVSPGHATTSFTQSPESRARSRQQVGGGMRKKRNGRLPRLPHAFTLDLTRRRFRRGKATFLKSTASRTLLCSTGTDVLRRWRLKNSSGKAGSRFRRTPMS
ncbi:site-specific DNA-methyltransferase [Cupriavidus cauae]|nr:site-specific DNA-methyltransferase [Cupriavidus cauae]